MLTKYWKLDITISDTMENKEDSLTEEDIDMLKRDVVEAILLISNTVNVEKVEIVEGVQ